MLRMVDTQVGVKSSSGSDCKDLWIWEFCVTAGKGQAPITPSEQWQEGTCRVHNPWGWKWKMLNMTARWLVAFRGRVGPWGGHVLRYRQDLEWITNRGYHGTGCCKDFREGSVS